MPLQVVVRDIYKERDIGRFTGAFSDIVEAHGVLALRLTPTKCCSAQHLRHCLTRLFCTICTDSGTAVIAKLAHLTAH